MTTQMKSKRLVSMTPESIEIDETMYPRVAGLDWDTVQHYSENLLDLPPPDVYEREKGKFVCIDGRHRVQAHILAGAKTIKVNVLTVKREAALVLAIEKNITHGKPLTKDDRIDLANKLHAQGKTNKAIAAILHMDVGTVGDYLKPVIQAEDTKTRQIITKKVAEGASIREITAEPSVIASHGKVEALVKQVKAGEDITAPKKEPAKTPQEIVGCPDYTSTCPDDPTSPQFGCSECGHLESVNSQPTVILTCKKDHPMYLNLDVFQDLFPAKFTD